MGTLYPDKEVEVNTLMVEALLKEQCPHLAHLPVEKLSQGWDNVLYRVGDEVLVRLPRRGVSATLLAHEIKWLPHLQPHLSLPIPAPLFAGHPTVLFPFEWTLVPYVEGRSVADTAVFDAPHNAVELAKFLGQLHRIPVPQDGAPGNEFRGVHPRERGAKVESLLTALGDQVDHKRARDVWSQGADAPGWQAAPVWSHGDMHPLNLLVDDKGKLCSVIDWGDLHAGEPAPDVAAAWMILSHEEHKAFRHHYMVDDATWHRARNWAMLFGLMFLEAGRQQQSSQWIKLGETITTRVLQEVA